MKQLIQIICTTILRLLALLLSCSILFLIIISLALGLKYLLGDFGLALLVGIPFVIYGSILSYSTGENLLDSIKNRSKK